LIITEQVRTCKTVRHACVLPYVIDDAHMWDYCTVCRVVPKGGGPSRGWRQGNAWLVTAGVTTYYTCIITEGCVP
jgi:hypothetical protein